MLTVFMNTKYNFIIQFLAFSYDNNILRGYSKAFGYLIISFFTHLTRWIGCAGVLKKSWDENENERGNMLFSQFTSYSVALLGLYLGW